MFSRKKPEPPKRRQHNLSQFGLTEIPDNFDPAAGVADVSDDSDLEAELARISGAAKKIKPAPKPTKTLVPENELNEMIAQSLRDISDDENDADDLENDEDLLGELQAINVGDNLAESDSAAEQNEDVETEPQSQPAIILPTTEESTVDILQKRIKIYQLAESNSKASGEGIKARRFGRALKTLQDLLKQASAGKPINAEDIPPEINVKSSADSAQPENTPAEMNKPLRPAPPPPPAPAEPLLPTQPDIVSDNVKQTEENIASSEITRMRSLQAEYKVAAVQAKRNGDSAAALNLLKVYKQFDFVIKMCEEGKEVDLSDMPPPPEQFLLMLAKMQQQNEEEQNKQNDADTEKSALPEQSPTAESPLTMLEALQQCLAKYKSAQDTAKAEGNASKVRRYGRLVTQFEDAVRTCKAGKPFAYEELPVPPGVEPLPIGNAGAAKKPEPEPARPASPSASTASTSVSSPTASSDAPKQAPHNDLTTRITGNQTKNNQSELQMKILLHRRLEYKEAAINAKKAGDIEQAKEYLKIYKGFEALLNAASSGLPVDLNTLPVPPSQRDNLEASFAIVSAEECDADDDGDDITEISVRMEEQLAKQLMMCKNTRDHYKAMGNIGGMNRFENLALTVQKDLDLVRYSKRQNFDLPKFHYEKRSFDIIHCNTDLTDNELELVIVRGLNYNVKNPKEVDTYVTAECPLLNDETFKARTNLIKDTDCPEYNQRFKIEIQRGNRQFQRIFKRHGVKLEVYSRGCSVECFGLSRYMPVCCFRGFLRSDTLIGSVTVKLQPLETKCDIHDTFDLMEGRKKIGGKLELKLRVRNPLLTKQIEHIDEKWLVLDT